MLGLTGYLACHGLTTDAILDYVRPLESCESLLLVGSVAEGLANPESDLDLLLVIGGSGGGLREDMLRVMPEGFDLNIEVIEYARAESLCGWFASQLYEVRPAMGADTLSLSFAGLDELRLLHRLRTGIPLTAPTGAIDALRHEFPLHALSDFALLQHGACHLRLRADAIQAASDPHTALLMCQLAAHHLIGAVLASVGETNPNQKWLLRLLHDHREALHPFPLEKLVRLVLPGVDSDTCDHTSLLISVSDTVMAILNDAADRRGSPVAGALRGLRHAQHLNTPMPSKEIA